MTRRIQTILLAIALCASGSGELKPRDRILVETDSPYLAPPPHRGRRNEPAYVAHTAAKGAEVFGLSLPEFAEATSRNFDRLFWKAAA